MSETIQSFEVTKGKKSGDLISDRKESKPLKVGLIGAGYFEYWRMYEGLREDVETAMQTVADHISEYADVVYPGLVDTLDRSDEAGQSFRKEGVELVVIAQGTYCVDYLIHQALLHLPENIPLILFASQMHSRLDFSVKGYQDSLANSGPMGLVQFACGLHKMGKYMNYEVVVGDVNDPEAYEEIRKHILIRRCIRDLKFWNIGLIGHIFRGMYDFQYDKTEVTGKFGPHVMDIDIKHLLDILEEIPMDDARVMEVVERAKREYEVTGLSDGDLARGARLGVAFEVLADRYRLDGLALLGQHFIEKEAQTTCYLGLSELLMKNRILAVTEGDVLGLIVSKVMKDITGKNPFFGEWEEVDTKLNAVEILGHGFIDPSTARQDRSIHLSRSCEDWGYEGNAPGFEATLPPGAATVSHIIKHGDTWKMLISEGDIPDLPALEIDECTVIMRVAVPVKEYYARLLKSGFSHHAIVASGHIGKELEEFANQLDIEVHRIS